jgi:glucosylceramidase
MKAQRMNKSILFTIRTTIFFFSLVMATSCTGKDKTNPDPPSQSRKVKVWLTSGDKSNLLALQNEVEFINSAPVGLAVVKADTSITYQTIDGYGAALTGSSAWLINQKLTPERQSELLKELFHPSEGIGVSYLRLTMGASDFSLSDFTYNDLPANQTDFELNGFSLSQDVDDVIPVMQKILGIYPGLKIVSSPWSPPAWMKTNNSLKGGKLKPACYPVYADYFIRYIQAMKGYGINIDAVTIQNEPLHFSANYPCMEMQPNEQQAFIRDHLGPKFSAAGIATKIITYDHNWDRPDYPISILNDPEAKKYIAGSAFHAYAGDVSAMGTVHNAHPDKDLYFTEISGGAWATDFAGNLLWNMRNIFIGTARNWSKNALLWNLALDENYGPQNNGCNNCRGVITINSASGEITRNEEYYAIAHFSKFVRPGAVRISANLPQSAGDAGLVAFQNPDGSKVMIAANYSSQPVRFVVEQGNKLFTVNLPATSVSTLVW